MNPLSNYLDKLKAEQREGDIQIRIGQALMDQRAKFIWELESVEEKNENNRDNSV